MLWGLRMFNWMAARGGRFWYGVLACYLSVLAFLSLNPWLRPAATAGILSPDKLEHAFAYVLLVSILFLCISKASNVYLRNTAHAWMAAIFIAVMIGILIEVAQTLFTRDRSGSVGDALANGAGAVLGYFIYNMLQGIFGKWAAKARVAPESR